MEMPITLTSSNYKKATAKKKNEKRKTNVDPIGNAPDIQ